MCDESSMGVHQSGGHRTYAVGRGRVGVLEEAVRALWLCVLGESGMMCVMQRGYQLVRIALSIMHWEVDACMGCIN